MIRRLDRVRYAEAMLNIGGGEILVIALVALIVVGPEQLPGVLRKAGRYASQVRSMTSGIRDEFMAGIDEVDPTKWTNDIEGRGDGSEDKPIVPRGYSDGHDEMRKPRAAYGSPDAARTTDPATLKPKSAKMASVNEMPTESAAEAAADTAGDTAGGTAAGAEPAIDESLSGAVAKPATDPAPDASPVETAHAEPGEQPAADATDLDDTK